MMVAGNEGQQIFVVAYCPFTGELHGDPSKASRNPRRLDSNIGRCPCLRAQYSGIRSSATRSNHTRPAIASRIRLPARTCSTSSRRDSCLKRGRAGRSCSIRSLTCTRGWPGLPGSRELAAARAGVRRRVSGAEGGLGESVGLMGVAVRDLQAARSSPTRRKRAVPQRVGKSSCTLPERRRRRGVDRESLESACQGLGARRRLPRAFDIVDSHSCIQVTYTQLISSPSHSRGASCDGRLHTRSQVFRGEI